MTPLRRRMLEDMQLRGVSARTQECSVTIGTMRALSTLTEDPLCDPLSRAQREMNPDRKIYDGACLARHYASPTTLSMRARDSKGPFFS